jgi:integrase
MSRQHNNGLRKICGCPRRGWAKCSHAWHFSFMWKGAPYRFSLDKQLERHMDSRTAAATEAERIRIEIKEGRFGQVAPRESMTLRQLADTYLERYVDVERPATAQGFRYAMATICRTELPRPVGGAAPVGDWLLTDIVTDTVERFREVRRGQGVGPVGVNRNLGSWRALYNWALRVGYVDRSPFKRVSEPVVKLSEEHGRSRRLDADADEEAALLEACAPHLHALVTAAIETGMRSGELTSLQWRQVEGVTVKGSKVTWGARAELVLPWAKTKTRRDRRIPISTRLKAILEMRRFGPDGEPLPDEAYVFGNEIGQRVESPKRAWQTAVLKSHGLTPAYTATCNLTPESRAALDGIDLHFHDLRREAGSRWLEGGVPLHTIRDWLGHTSIAQTSTYLAGTAKTQHDAMRQYEERLAVAERAAQARGRRLQDIANGSKTGGRKSPQSAGAAARKANRTGIGRHTEVM